MIKADVTLVELGRDANEISRLRKLYSLGLMDTPDEVEFDELTQLAAAVCGTPHSMMTLVDSDRQWFKAKVGLGFSETPIEVSFCRHAILAPTELFVVEDTWKDERFAANALVTGEPGIRFYAGMPLHILDEHAVGTLCVIDTVPRHLTQEQENALRVLARQVRARIELRLQRDALQKALEEREAALASMRAGEARFRAFMNASPFLSFIKDTALQYVFYNKQFANHFGISMECLLGKTDNHLPPSKMVEEILGGDTTALTDGQIVELECALPGPHGAMEHWKSVRFRCFDSMGAAMIAGIAQNITVERDRDRAIKLYQQQLEEANKLLSRLATTDALTGLSNRRAFEERLEIDFSMALRKKRPLTIVMIDLDNFKLRNDRHGHAAGDQVLRDAASILTASIRLTDHAARYGGEEFAILLPETDTRAAWLWAERFQQSMRDFAWQDDPATVSIGLGTINGRTLSGADLVGLADAALYEAKRRGRNRIVHYGGMEALAAEDLLGTA